MRAVIFDLDGTLLDTLDDLANTMNYILETNGYPVRSRAEVQARVGNGILKLIIRSLPVEGMEERARELLPAFKAHYGEHCADFTKPYEGIPELLDLLKKEGFRLAVVSNKADFAVKELCEQYFPGVFEVTVGEREGIRKKPAPDSVYEVLNLLNCRAEEAVYIGDSEVDVMTAKNAGLAGIYVLWGFRSRECILEAGGESLAESPEELKVKILGVFSEKNRK